MCFTDASFKKNQFYLVFLKVTFHKPCVLLMQASNNFNFTWCFWSSLFINHVFYWCKLQKVYVLLDVWVVNFNFTWCFWSEHMCAHLTKDTCPCSKRAHVVLLNMPSFFLGELAFCLWTLTIQNGLKGALGALKSTLNS